MVQRLAGKIILLSGWRRAGLAFLIGALASFALPPYDFFAVCFVSFPVLVWLIDGAVDNADLGPIRRLLPAAAIGWWFGFGYFVFGLWWIGNALLVDAENFAWAIPFAILGLPAFLRIFLRPGNRTRSSALERRAWSCPGSCLWLRHCRMAALLYPHRLPMERHWLCCHARADADAVICHSRIARHERAGCDCLCHARLAGRSP